MRHLLSRAFFLFTFVMFEKLLRLTNFFFIFFSMKDKSSCSFFPKNPLGLFTTVFQVLSLLNALFRVTNFTWAAFFSGISFLRCCTTSATDLRKLFLHSSIFYLRLMPTFGLSVTTTCFYQGFLGSWSTICFLNDTLFSKRYYLVDSVYVKTPVGKH